MLKFALQKELKNLELQKKLLDSTGNISKMEQELERMGREMEEKVRRGKGFCFIFLFYLFIYFLFHFFIVI